TFTAVDTSSNSVTKTCTYQVNGVTYKPAGQSCIVNGSLTPGHVILQPVNADNTSVFKQGSTVPAKFCVFDANCNSVGTPGVVSSSILQSVNGAPAATVNA